MHHAMLMLQPCISEDSLSILSWSSTLRLNFP